MIKLIKYKNSNQNDKKFFLFFLSFFIFLYVGLGQNVTTNEINTAITTINFNFGQTSAYSIICNQQNILFISTDTGILQYDGSIWTHIPCKGKHILAEDSHNNIVVANLSFLGRIKYLKGIQSIDTIIIPAVLQNWKQPEDAFYVGNNLFISAKSKLWLFSNNSLNEVDSSASGLKMFKGKECIYLVKSNERQITRLSADGNEVFSNLTFLSKNNNIIDLEEGAEYIWIKSHSKGLIKLNKKTLHQESTFANNTIDWNSYSKTIEILPGKLLIVLQNSQSYLIDEKDNALLPLNCKPSDNNDIIDLLYDKNKSLWLLYNHSLVRVDFFNEKNLPLSNQNFSVVLTKVFIEGDSILYQYQPWEKQNKPSIQLNPATRHLTFEYTATDYRSGSNVSFSSILEGFETKWSEWRFNKSIVYNNLPRGNFTFRVKAKNSQGKIAPEAMFSFSIKAPIYIRWWAWLFYIFISLTIIILYFRKRRLDFHLEKTKLEHIINQRTAELRREKAKTDELLANLLPKDTADELKNTGKATSQKFNLVTVLFSDIQGFSQIAEQMNPEKLIDELDSFFFHFDSVADKYNIEKIKTIGDAYMCAGGIPYKNRTNPVEVVLAAMEMQEYMKQLKLKNNNIWDLRIGIHTGAVIAGVVGHKRYSYDIWGDTVNTASRMESSGEAGKVNISGHTFDLVKDFFICENRGKMPVKYKGDIDMYFVKGIRPELSVDLKVVPNKKFFLQLQALRLHDLEEFIIEKLNKELPINLYFHNSKYTKDIYTQVELIGRAEEASPEELLLLRTAALFLNTGFITNYSDYIHASKKFASEILPKFKYSDEQIKVITDLIHSTQRIHKVSNKQETILLDASLNYLGRVDYNVIIMNQFKEIKERTPNISEEEWLNQQQKILEQYPFYTNTAKLLREVSAQEQIQKLREAGKLNI